MGMEEWRNGERIQEQETGTGTEPWMWVGRLKTPEPLAFDGRRITTVIQV
jgi:hypothetical protein